MIITRSPLRLSWGGGGTDLPSYYREHGGFLIASAIDKYLYIILDKIFVPGIILKYSQMERANAIEEVKHPIFREALQFLNLKDPAIEIASMADIPAGTGLGSSGSFTTALLKGLHLFQRNNVTPQQLAEEACHIEIDRLGSPIGKQDQYIAAFGGITCFEFNKDDSVSVSRLRVSEETIFSLEDNLLLFFTGFTRAASEILSDQNKKTIEKNQEMIDQMHEVKEIGRETKACLESGDVTQFGKLMDRHWQRKRQRSKGMSNPQIDSWYDLARNNGAVGGKLVGAGGGGFLLFLAEDKSRLRHALRETGLREVRFKFDFEGTKVLAA